MDDIAPSLLKAIRNDFESQFGKSDLIATLYKKIRAGTASYAEANDFAIEAGKILASAFRNNLSSEVLPNGKLYYNIAKQIVEPMMKNNYTLITEVTDQVQQTLNEAAGIGIKPITPELNQDRIDGILDKASSAEVYDDVAWALDEPMVNFSQSIVDAAVKANAEFHAKAGLKPKIIRKVAGDCCNWCKNLAGTYSYPNDVPDDVYRRHQRCRCSVDYIPGDGKVQNAHTKKWQSQEEYDKIEIRKRVGIRTKSSETPQEKERRIAKENGLVDNAQKAAERIQKSKEFTAKDLERMSMSQLRENAQRLAAEWYKSGLSGISFQGYDVEKAAELLTAQGSRTSLKKDILSIQKAMRNSTTDGVKVNKVISGHSGTPKIANANSIIDHLDEKGGVDARTYYGSDGLKKKDIHVNNHGNPKWHNYGVHGEHGHDYEWSLDGSLKNKTTRELSIEERKENGDIL